MIAMAHPLLEQPLSSDGVSHGSDIVQCIWWAYFVFVNSWLISNSKV